MGGWTPKSLLRQLSTKVCTAILGFAVIGLAETAWSCADEVGRPAWRLSGPYYDGFDRPALTPGNDTRVNLIWLMRSVHPVSDANASYQTNAWDNSELGYSFLTWSLLRQTYWPHKEQDDTPSTKTVACTPSANAAAAFTAAVAADTSLPVSDRSVLETLRSKVGCETVDWSVPLTSRRSHEYRAYLQATAAFYGNDWQTARQGFAALAHARSPWIADTATYMPIRIALRAATAKATNKYGDFDFKAVDATQVTAARTAIAAYLKAFPRGHYVASAQGLIRRTMWLASDVDGLAQSYEQLLTQTPADSERAADLAEEIDRALLSNDQFDTVIRQTKNSPLLLAVSDLRQMRRPVVTEAIKLAEADLAVQASAFTGLSDLYSFLRATRAYYTGDKPETVLAEVPEDLHSPDPTPLAYSRQVLRGMALAKASDTSEARFWAGLIAIAQPVFQRPFAELGLAIHWQQANRLDLVFAAGSPVEDTTIRKILIQTIAPAVILRAEAGNPTRPADERDVARFTLLYKDLSRQAYADFGRDVALVPADALVRPDSQFWDVYPVSVGLFNHGKWSDGFPCPALAVTAKTLALKPQDRRARLCLGDFWRLDGFSLLNTDQGADTLGHRPDQFPGTTLHRDEIYRAILADPHASPDERAYALYRAVMCYASSGRNGCGDLIHEWGDMSQRKAWFLELKHRYRASQWAKILRYYW